MSVGRSGFCVVVALSVAFVVMSGFAVIGAHALEASTGIENPVVVVKSAGGPNEKVVTRTWTCSDSGTWHHWLVNSGLKALSIDIYEKTRGKTISVYSSEIVFSEVGAYPSGTVCLDDLAVVKDKVYKFVLVPSGRTGSSAQYFHELGGMVPPVASFTYSGAGLMITANAADSHDSDGYIVGYAWDWGDGDTGSGVVATHTYAEWSAPTVTLTVIDDDGLVGTVSKHFPIWPFVVWGFTYGPDGALLPDCAVVVSNLRTGSFLTTVSEIDAYYQVDFNRITGGWALGDTIRVAATKGTMSGWTDALLTENLPFLQIDASLYGLLPLVASFAYTVSGTTVSVDASASTSDVGIVSYAWNFDNWVIASGVTHSHIYVSPGIYTVTLTVTDKLGNMDSSSQSVTVSSGLPPDSYWYTVWGTTYASDGLTPLAGCAVTITNVRTGETMIDLQSDGTGLYICDVTALTTVYGDILLVRATGPSGQTGSATGVVDYSMPYMSINVTLS